MAGHIDSPRRFARQNRDDISELDVARQPAALGSNLIGVERRPEAVGSPRRTAAESTRGRHQSHGSAKRCPIELSSAKRGECLDALSDPCFLCRDNKSGNHGVDVSEDRRRRLRVTYAEARTSSANPRIRMRDSRLQID